MKQLLIVLYTVDAQLNTVHKNVWMVPSCLPLLSLPICTHCRPSIGSSFSLLSINGFCAYSLCTGYRWPMITDSIFVWSTSLMCLISWWVLAPSGKVLCVIFVCRTLSTWHRLISSKESVQMDCCKHCGLLQSIWLYAYMGFMAIFCVKDLFCQLLGR